MYVKKGKAVRMSLFGILGKKKKESPEEYTMRPLRDNSIPEADLFPIDDVPLPEEAKREETESVVPEPKTIESGKKPTIIEEQPPKEKVPAEEVDFSLPDFSEEDFKIGEQAEEETKEEKVIPTPKLVQDFGPENKYLDLENCKRLFENISTIQEMIKEEKNSFQKEDNLGKNILQHYKNSHDNLDLIQEDLMEIDRTLFER